jgi:hypothetical protein
MSRGQRVFTINYIIFQLTFDLIGPDMNLLLFTSCSSTIMYSFSSLRNFTHLMFAGLQDPSLNHSRWGPFISVVFFVCLLIVASYQSLQKMRFQSRKNAALNLCTVH